MQNKNYYTQEGFDYKENVITATIKFNPQHQIFEGHFPGQPVVPGVCMVEIVKKLMEQALGSKLMLTKGNQLKFLQLVVPNSDENILAEIRFSNSERIYAFNAVFKKDESAIFKMSGEYTINKN